MKFNELPPVEVLKSLFDYDENTGDLIWKKNVSKNVKQGTVAGYTLHGYRCVTINKTIYRQHRIIYKIHHNEDPGNMQVDHVNGEKTDNRISNLRLATASQNQHNLPSSHIEKNYNKYRVTFMKDGERVFRQSFTTLKEAKQVVTKLKKQLHGEFSNVSQ